MLKKLSANFIVSEYYTVGAQLEGKEGGGHFTFLNHSSREAFHTALAEHFFFK